MHEALHSVHSAVASLPGPCGCVATRRHSAAAPGKLLAKGVCAPGGQVQLETTCWDPAAARLHGDTLRCRFR